GSFAMQYRRHGGIVQARLTTAGEAPQLDEQIRESLKDRFEGKMVFSHKVKPELIGGFVLEIDDKVMDTSVKSKLEKIRRHFDDLNKRLV
ncbi:MAG: F0F1 ATP synthase subunit delta, partial [Candidatus Cryptobacteroides sp.]